MTLDISEVLSGYVMWAGHDIETRTAAREAAEKALEQFRTEAEANAYLSAASVIEAGNTATSCDHVELVVGWLRSKSNSLTARARSGCTSDYHKRRDDEQDQRSA